MIYGMWWYHRHRHGWSSIVDYYLWSPIRSEFFDLLSILEYDILSWLNLFRRGLYLKPACVLVRPIIVTMAAYESQTVTSDPTNVSRRVSTDDGTIASPLQIFDRAKKQINGIFVDILNYVTDASKRIKGNYYCYRHYFKWYVCLWNRF